MSREAWRGGARFWSPSPVEGRVGVNEAFAHRKTHNALTSALETPHTILSNKHVFYSCSAISARRTSARHSCTQDNYRTKKLTWRLVFCFQLARQHTQIARKVERWYFLEHAMGCAVGRQRSASKDSTSRDPLDDPVTAILQSTVGRMCRQRRSTRAPTLFLRAAPTPAGPPPPD